MNEIIDQIFRIIPTGPELGPYKGLFPLATHILALALGLGFVLGPFVIAGGLVLLWVSGSSKARRSKATSLLWAGGIAFLLPLLLMLLRDPAQTALHFVFS